VARSADATAIRLAYRERARRYHPDRAAGASADEMAAVNEAYRVLGDPGRRALYDRSLVGSGSARPASTPHASWSPSEAAGAHPTALPPARMPWKFMAWMAALGVCVVLVGAALFEPTEEPGPDGLLQPGSCVEREINNVVREVSCDVPGAFVVDRLVALDASCPFGTAYYLDRQGMGAACIVVPDAAP
jgi:hypothetical protein